MLAASCCILFQLCWGPGSGEDSSLHKNRCHWFSVHFLCHLAYLRPPPTPLVWTFPRRVVRFPWSANGSIEVPDAISQVLSRLSNTVRTHYRCWDMLGFWPVALWEPPCWCIKNTLRLLNCGIFGIFHRCNKRNGSKLCVFVTGC